MRSLTTSILGCFAVLGMACSEGGAALGNGAGGSGGSADASTGMGGSSSPDMGGGMAGTEGMTSDAGGAGVVMMDDGGGMQPDVGADGLRHGPFKMLVISTTLEFHHDSIPTCLQMLQDLGSETTDADFAAIGAPAGSTWKVDQVGSDSYAVDYFSEITAENLKNYEIVYSDSSTGPVFTNAPNGAEKKQIFEDYWTNGGAWAGQHAATDFEKNDRWTWFQDNVNGAWWVMQDADQTPGTVVWETAYTNHSILKGLESPWNANDEWYIMNRNVEEVPGFKVLAKVTVPSSTLDTSVAEQAYPPDAKTPRPAVWITENAKGARSFYTIRGHNKTVYAEQQFRDLMLRGILWAVHRLP